MKMADYEFPFQCDEARRGETWQAAEWVKHRDRRGIREWKVTAYYECQHCGEVHETITIAPRPLD